MGGAETSYYSRALDQVMAEVLPNENVILCMIKHNDIFNGLIIPWCSYLLNYLEH